MRSSGRAAKGRLDAYALTSLAQERGRGERHPSGTARCVPEPFPSAVSRARCGVRDWVDLVGLVSQVRVGVSTPGTSTFSGSPAQPGSDAGAPGMLRSIDTRSSFVAAGSGTRYTFIAGHWLGRTGIPSGAVRGGRRRGGGPARPCLGGGGSAWGDALGVRMGVLVSGDGPLMRGVRGVGQSAGAGDRRHGGSVTAECGRRGSTVKAGRSLRWPPSLCPCPGFTGSGRLRHPLGRARFGTGVTPCNPRFAAQVPGHLSWRAKRLRFGGHRVAALPHHCPPQGFPGLPCPSPENRTRGGRRRQWAGGTPRQQER